MAWLISECACSALCGGKAWGGLGSSKLSLWLVLYQRMWDLMHP